MYTNYLDKARIRLACLGVEDINHNDYLSYIENSIKSANISFLKTLLDEISMEDKDNYIISKEKLNDYIKKDIVIYDDLFDEDNDIETNKTINEIANRVKNCLNDSFPGFELTSIMVKKPNNIIETREI